MPSFEDFIAGKPLNDELARIKRGEAEPQGDAEDSPILWGESVEERPLDDRDRMDLRKLMAEPGWKVLERLRKRTLKVIEEEAILASQNNPLANSQKIATGWANFNAFKQQAEVDVAMMKMEIAKLAKPKGKDETQPA